MTINTRNKTIIAGIGISVLLFAGFIIASILLFGKTDVEHEIILLIISLAGELLFALTAIIILYLSFRKTRSPEIFFFIVFCISMCFDSLKVPFVLFNAIEIAPYYGVILTRAVYFGRFLGTMAVLTSGLFSLGAQYQRMEIYAGVSFLLAFALSAAVTIDITETDPIFLFKMGHTRELGIISVIFLFFGVFNYLLYAIQSASRNHFLIALGLTGVIAGREMLFYTHSVITVAGALCLLIAGTVLYGERTRAVYLWT